MSPVDHSHLMMSRRRFLQGAASAAAFSLLPGCGYQSSPNSQAISGSDVDPPASAVVQSSLIVGTASLGTIPSRFMGLSYEKLAMTYGYFHPSNKNLIALFRLLGAGVLRLGGGSVDKLLWTTDVTSDHAHITSAEIKALAGFLEATGWLCIYGVNLATSTPALAAEEVAAAVSALGTNLFGIELGNEPDEYGTAGSFFPGDWTFEDYLSVWNSFHSAILQGTPNVPITGPATGGGNDIVSWTLALGQTLTPGELVLLTQHYYRAAGYDPIATVPFLISPDTQLTGELSLLNAGAQKSGIPYRMSECNSFYHGGTPGVSNTYASSLWVIDFLFDVALGGATGVNLHGGGNAPGYTPIADDSGAVIEARPEYYGLLLFSLAGPGDLLQTQLSFDGAVYANAYAVQNASGGLNLIVVNKDELQSMNLTIETPQIIQTATLQTMTGSSLDALTGVTIGGATVNIDGSFAPARAETLTTSGNQTTCTIPALSAGLISITRLNN